jgi:hypothetical protein
MWKELEEAQAHNPWFALARAQGPEQPRDLEVDKPGVWARGTRAFGARREPCARYLKLESEPHLPS